MKLNSNNFVNYFHHQIVLVINFLSFKRKTIATKRNSRQKNRTKKEKQPALSAAAGHCLLSVIDLNFCRLLFFFLNVPDNSYGTYRKKGKGLGKTFLRGKQCSAATIRINSAWWGHFYCEAGKTGARSVVLIQQCIFLY